MSDQAAEQSQASVEQQLANWMTNKPMQQQKAPPAQEAVQQEQAPEGQQEQQAEVQAPEIEELDYEGERFQVPKKLAPAIMQHKDYTQKTQALSEKSKAVEVAQKEVQLSGEQRAFEQSITGELNAIRMLDAQLSQQIDWNNMSVEDMLRTRATLDQLKDQRNNLDAEVRRKEADFRASLQTQYEELQTKSREVLARKIPGWNAEVEKGVKEWAISQGFTTQEVSRILNPVHAETLYKAQQYDKLLAGKAAAQAQAASAAPMGKPGSVNPMPQAVKEQLAFRRAIKAATPGTAEHQRIVVQRAGSLFSKR